MLLLQPPLLCALLSSCTGFFSRVRQAAEPSTSREEKQPFFLLPSNISFKCGWGIFPIFLLRLPAPFIAAAVERRALLPFPNKYIRSLKTLAYVCRTRTCTNVVSKGVTKQSQEKTLLHGNRGIVKALFFPIPVFSTGNHRAFSVSFRARFQTTTSQFDLSSIEREKAFKISASALYRNHFVWVVWLTPLFCYTNSSFPISPCLVLLCRIRHCSAISSCLIFIHFFALQRNWWRRNVLKEKPMRCEKEAREKPFKIAKLCRIRLKKAPSLKENEHLFKQSDLASCITSRLSKNYSHHYLSQRRIISCF